MLLLDTGFDTLSPVKTRRNAASEAFHTHPGFIRRHRSGAETRNRGRRLEISHPGCYKAIQKQDGSPKLITSCGEIIHLMASSATTNEFAALVHPELSLGKWVPTFPTWNPLCRAVLGLGNRLINLLSRTPPGLTARTVHIPTTDGTATIPTYIASPTSPSSALLPGILWIHGGGIITGSYQIEYPSIHKFAQPHPDRLPSGAVVVSPDYRLAVEHPAPAPGDDCFAAWLWMVEHAAELGIDPSRIVVGGASAGGGMAALLVQRILDLHRTSPTIYPLPALQLLIYPMLDDRTVARVDAEVAAGHIAQSHYPAWSPRANRFAWTAYLDGKEGKEVAVPGRREVLAGLPPAWIGVGTLDLFYEEDVEYAKRLEAAGVETVLEVVQGAWHAFDVVCGGTEVVKAFEASQFRAMRQALAQT